MRGQCKFEVAVARLCLCKWEGDDREHGKEHSDPIHGRKFTPYLENPEGNTFRRKGRVPVVVFLARLGRDTAEIHSLLV